MAYFLKGAKSGEWQEERGKYRPSDDWLLGGCPECVRKTRALSPFNPLPILTENQ